MKKKQKTKLVELTIQATNSGYRCGVIRVRVPEDADEDDLDQLANEVINGFPSDGMWDDDEMNGEWEVFEMEVEELSPDDEDGVPSEYYRLPGGQWERKP